MRARVAAATPAPSAATGPAPVPIVSAVRAEPVGSAGRAEPVGSAGRAEPVGSAGRAEASTRTIQTVLFVLGGLLLGTAAIVFTAVAWATFGVRGRALILGSFTALALAAPLFALRRRLVGTAETFAAVGLLLVLLDGYAAWYVNLFGVADGSVPGYAAAVCAVTAAVAAGYASATGLVGPRFAALAVAQPVLPLAGRAGRPGRRGLGVHLQRGGRRGHPGVPPDRRVALARCGSARGRWSGWRCRRPGCACPDGRAGIADTPGAAALAGSAAAGRRARPVGGSVLARRQAFQALAGAVAGRRGRRGGRPVPHHRPGRRTTRCCWPAVVAGLAGAVTLAGRVLPARVRTGPYAAAVALAG